MTRGQHCGEKLVAGHSLGLLCMSLRFPLINNLVFLLFYFRHRHVPKAVFKAAKEKKIMMASIKRKYVAITAILLCYINAAVNCRAYARG